MLRLLNNSKYLIYNDENYKNAVNYKQSFYNDPITFNYKGKKYILSSGNSDSISLYKEGEIVYVLSANDSLDYISLDYISTLQQEFFTGVFLESNDLNNKENICFELFEKEEKKQIRLLVENYLY